MLGNKNQPAVYLNYQWPGFEMLASQAKTTSALGAMKKCKAVSSCEYLPEASVRNELGTHDRPGQASSLLASHFHHSVSCTIPPLEKHKGSSLPSSLKPKKIHNITRQKGCGTVSNHASGSSLCVSSSCQRSVASDPNCSLSFDILDDISIPSRTCLPPTLQLSTQCSSLQNCAEATPPRQSATDPCTHPPAHADDPCISSKLWSHAARLPNLEHAASVHVIDAMLSSHDDTLCDPMGWFEHSTPSASMKSIGWEAARASDLLLLEAVACGNASGASDGASGGRNTLPAPMLPQGLEGVREGPQASPGQPQGRHDGAGAGAASAFSMGSPCQLQPQMQHQEPPQPSPPPPLHQEPPKPLSPQYEEQQQQQPQCGAKRNLSVPGETATEGPPLAPNTSPHSSLPRPEDPMLW